MKKLKELELKYNHQISNIFLGNYKTAFKGRGIEFSSFKNYEYLEDSKNIDWLVSAREGKILTKYFKEDRELEVLFLFDITESMSFGLINKKINTLIEVFYLFGLSSLSSGGSIGAVFLGEKRDIINFGKGKSAIIKILNKINTINNKKVINERKINFKNVLNYKDKLIFVLSDKIEIDEKTFHILSLKNDVIYINIFDNFENTLSGVEGIIGLGGLSVDLDNKAKKNKYLEIRKQSLDNLKKKINKYGGDYLSLDNKSNIYKKVLKLMKERQR